MFAQIATFEETPEQLTEGLRHLQEEVVPSFGQPEGLLAAYWLVDPASGRRLTLMIWDNPEAQAAAMPAIMQGIGARRAAAGRQNPPNSPTSVAKYEIFAQAVSGRAAELASATT